MRDVTFIEIHAALAQQLAVFLLECACAMGTHTRDVQMA